MRFSHCFMRLNKHKPHTHTQPHRQKARTHVQTHMHFMICREKDEEKAARERESDMDTYSLACLDRLTKQTLRHVFCLYTLRIRTMGGPYISYLRFVSAQQHQHTDTVPSTRTHCSHVCTLLNTTWPTIAPQALTLARLPDFISY